MDRVLLLRKLKFFEKGVKIYVIGIDKRKSLSYNKVTNKTYNPNGGKTYEKRTY